MSDPRSLLGRESRRFVQPDGAFERLVRRRDRKRRNQRIAAGVVGIAVFVAAIWVVTSVSSLDRSKTSVVPAGDVTGPPETGLTETGPTGPAETGPAGSVSTVNVIDLPPEGASPSSPEHGELVLSLAGRGIAADHALTHMYLYADGRLIWWREADLPAGATGHDVLEQRLTPEGVELMRSEVISSGLIDPDYRNGSMAGRGAGLSFLGMIQVRDGDALAGRFFDTYIDTIDERDIIATAKQERALEFLDARLADPASWLPASAWADQEIRPWVPTTYRVCYGGTTETIKRDRLLNAIPGPVQELLEAREAENEQFNEYVSFGAWLNGVRVTRYCSELTTEEARDVVRGLDDGGYERTHARSTFEYFFSVPDLVGTAAVWIDPYLPHGEAVCIPCG